MSMKNVRYRFQRFVNVFALESNIVIRHTKNELILVN